MSRSKRILSLVFTLWLLAHGGLSLAADPKALAEKDVISLVELQIDDSAIIAKIRKSGLNFDVDDEALARLKAAGASDAVLQAAREGGRAKTPAAPGQAVTYQDVLKLVSLGVDEEAILKRLAKSPTVFTLDAAQTEELKKAGASEKLLAALAGQRPPSEGSGDVTDFAIVLDCSGSMLERTKDNQPKMTIAKKVVADLIQRVPNGLRLTFVIYGHDKRLECQAVKVVRELSVIDGTGKAELAAEVGSLQPSGATPIALALRTAGKELAKNDAYCGLVLISDGKETCKGDPAAEAARLAHDLKLSFGINVIGFDVSADERKSLEEIAKAGKGKYVNAQTAKELTDSLGALAKRLEVEAKPAPSQVSNRRAVKVLKPTFKLPPLAAIAVVKAGEFGPDVKSNYAPVVEGKKYDEEIRLPSADAFDLLWIPAEGKHLRMVRKFSIKERKLVELKPEDYLGLVRVSGEGLPKPKIIALVEVGQFGPDVASNFKPVQLCNQFGTDMVVPAGTYDLWFKSTDGTSAQKLEEKLIVKAGEVVEVGGSSADGDRPAGRSARRAIKVLPPTIKLPPLKMIAVVDTGDFGPDVKSNYKPVIEGKTYGDEIWLPSDKEYDVLWVPEEGKHVRMLKKFSVKERKLVQIKPEEQLGLVRVTGEGLPAPKIIALVATGDFGPDTPSNFSPVQSTKKYGTDMVAPVGIYDVWIQPASGKSQKLEEKLQVEAGKAIVLD